MLRKQNLKLHFLVGAAKDPLPPSLHHMAASPEFLLRLLLVSSFFAALFAAPAAPASNAALNAAPAQYVFSLSLKSPLSSAIYPPNVDIAIIPNLDLLSQSAEEPPTADGSLLSVEYELAEGGEPEIMDEDRALSVISSLNLDLCIYVLPSKIHSCAPLTDFQEENAHLLDPKAGESHTLYMWLQSSDQNNLSVDPISAWSDGFARTSSTFFVSSPPTSPATATSRTTNTPATATLTDASASVKEEEVKQRYGDPLTLTLEDTTSLRTQRAKYFDEVYNLGIWAFPDFGGEEVNKVLSGFGSTQSETRSLRRHLSMFMDYERVTTLVDLPCGDLNWIGGLSGMQGDKQGTLKYFGGDVSEVVLGLNRDKYQDKSRFKFGKVDIVGDRVFDNLDLRSQIFHEPTSKNAPVVLLNVRHLQFHLNVAENLSVLDRIAEFVSDIETHWSKTTTASGGNPPKVFVLLSTFLRSNNNLSTFPLASGHFINLLRYPYCMKDPALIIQDGVDDMFAAVFEGGRVGRGGRDDEGKRCL